MSMRLKDAGRLSFFLGAPPPAPDTPLTEILALSLRTSDAAIFSPPIMYITPLVFWVWGGHRFIGVRFLTPPIFGSFFFFPHHRSFVVISLLLRLASALAFLFSVVFHSCSPLFSGIFLPCSACVAAQHRPVSWSFAILVFSGKPIFFLSTTSQGMAIPHAESLFFLPPAFLSRFPPFCLPRFSAQDSPLIPVSLFQVFFPGKNQSSDIFYHGRSARLSTPPIPFGPPVGRPCA